jgi:SAM-dependent methyltransferase
MSKSKDYHDYVFRDGKLVGEFEEMYRHSATVPWHQDEQENWIDIRLTREMLKDLGSYDEIHDLGCGTGHYLELIKRDFLSPEGKGYGYDLSATACNLARDLFPLSEFAVLDLTADSKEQIAKSRQQRADSRLFMIRGTLWYVFPKLTNVIGNIFHLMETGDYLLVVQNFPPLHKSFIGKDVIPNHTALIKHFSSRFSLERYIWHEDTLKEANDNWFIGLFSVEEPVE